MADKSRNELRGFILNDTEGPRGKPRSWSTSPCCTRRAETRKCPGSEFDSFGFDLLFRFRTAEADCGHGNRLIVPADAKGGIESVGLGPAFDEPERVGTAGSESF